MAEKLLQAPEFVSQEDEVIPDAASSDNARKDKQSGSQICKTDAQCNVGVELKDRKGSEEGQPKGSTDSPGVIVDKSAVDSSSVQQNPAQSDTLKLEVNPLSGEGDVRRSTDSPSCHEAASLRNSSDLLVHRHGGSSAGDTPRKVARQSVGSDRSVDRSPMQAKIHGLAPLTPGRSRLRSVTRGDDSPDRSPAVPKFGDWDDTDPATGEEYTQLFERVREEKHNETGKVPSMSTETSFSNGQKQFGNGNPKGCSCFPWTKR